ncbi:MAG: hypothetical protein BAJATHORv1_10523 [Candidatus Thorarchaeota archaeon]|nr:MAG: hypothetical protein BAJATHORv1_10523 [Candidatus Thorarchaeota archaeon]
MNEPIPPEDLEEINKELEYILGTNKYQLRQNIKDNVLGVYLNNQRSTLIDEIPIEIWDTLNREELITYILQVANNHIIALKTMRRTVGIPLLMMIPAILLFILIYDLFPEPFRRIAASLISVAVWGVAFIPFLYRDFIITQFQADKLTISQRSNLIEVYRKMEELTKSKNKVVSYRSRVGRLEKYLQTQIEMEHGI